MRRSRLVLHLAGDESAADAKEGGFHEVAPRPLRPIGQRLRVEVVDAHLNVSGLDDLGALPAGEVGGEGVEAVAVCVHDADV